MNLKLTLSVVCVLFLCACQTSTTQMTRPRALEPLHPEVTVNMQGGFSGSVLEDAETLSNGIVNEARSGEQLSEEEVRELLDASLRLVLFSPSVLPEIIGRLGVSNAPLEGIDVGLRYNGALVKGDVKWQLWGPDDGAHAVAIYFGYAHHLSVASSLIEFASLSNFSRSDIDVGLSYGFDFGDFGGIYIGPRFLHSWVGVEPKLEAAVREQFPESIREMDPSQYFEDQQISFIGGTSALMLGYSAVFLVVELSVFHAIFKPTVLGESTDLSGVFVAPSVGFMVSF